MKKVVVAMTMAFAVAAFAGEHGSPPPQGGQGQLQGQAQGQAQLQGQLQGQQQSSRSSSRASSASASQAVSASSSRSGNSSANNTGNTQNAQQTASPTYTNINPNQVASAIAPSVVATPETCVEGLSGGFQNKVFGISLGAPVTSHDCKVGMRASYLMAVGLKDVAIATLCDIPEIAAKMKATGHESQCGTPMTADKKTASVQAPAGSALSSYLEHGGNDDVVIARLGGKKHHGKS